MNLSIDFGDKAHQAQGEVVTSLEDAAQTAEAEVLRVLMTPAM